MTWLPISPGLARELGILLRSDMAASWDERGLVERAGKSETTEDIFEFSLAGW